ncbi:DNA repair protein REV1 [Plasmodium gonderi]|uniref:DNA repair protein REV1 n=1 Tax=Plasmodium gonderi TaxID=77519 RepID=A0A1Y1JD53_PLAGO|nr:DNA repair protein REV1 [Plasmodium gonderi]GAW80170.1 DNA repair protein REV1 [Plasmodium gonderi]
MDVEYGGSRSFSKYMWRKEEKTPLSYKKKYSAEIEESGSHGNLNNRSLFADCNFYIDDFVSLFSLYNSYDKDSRNKSSNTRNSNSNNNNNQYCKNDNESYSKRTTLHTDDENKLKYPNEWTCFMNNSVDDKTVYRYHNDMNSQANFSTPYNNYSVGEDNNKHGHLPCNDLPCNDLPDYNNEKGEYGKLHNHAVENEDEYMMLDKTPIKSSNFNIVDPVFDKNENRNEFDTFMKRYESVYSRKRNVRASYINKKEELEIMIIQNGGIIHNALTSRVTHIISNNMALGSKKYMDYKKAVKKSKVFIVVDKYISDCVSFQCRLPEQSYLPSLLRYNSRPITDFFSIKKRKYNNGHSSLIKKIETKENANVSNVLRENSIPISSYEERKIDLSLGNFQKKDLMNYCNEQREHAKCGEITMNDQPFSVERETCISNYELQDRKNNITQRDKNLLILNMQMSYENLKKYILYNSFEYFKRLRKFYLNKELKENAFPNVSSNLYINSDTFEEFSRKYRILNHLSKQEIDWIKKKSELNINIRNVWENDIIHFFFDIVLKARSQFEVVSTAGSTIKNNHNDNNGDSNGDNNGDSNGDNNGDSNGDNNGDSNGDSNDDNNGDNNGDNSNETVAIAASASDGNRVIDREKASDKLIESVSAYLHNSRLYILGNWNYISREFFQFEDIKENDKRKFVYLYIDFDNYFLNASVKSANNQYSKKNKIKNHEILCVCHSLKKRESYGIISATNYWGKKNKIVKGMVKGDVTKMHKNNIHFVKYDFSNILRCSYLFLLVLINYSKNVRVLSVDESILQLFYENEEDIFLTAKRISDDIYNLTNLSISIGISSDLTMSKKALKFCKKRFLFFDYYHHFCIFIMKKYILNEKKKNQNSNSMKWVHSRNSNHDMVKQHATLKNDKHLDKHNDSGDTHNINIKYPFKMDNKKDDIIRINNCSMEDDKLENMALNYEELKNLFNEYIISEEERKLSKENGQDKRSVSDLNGSYCVDKEDGKKQLQVEGEKDNAANTCNVSAESDADMYFLNAMKEIREKKVDLIFNKFIEMNEHNLEYIMDTFFDRVIHPISRFFFFYKKNEHYLDILKKLNYLSGEFVHFNIYYLPHDKTVPLQFDNQQEAALKKLQKKNMHKVEEEEEEEGEGGKWKKSINISVNYGVRFQKINDFYFLIYFMTKQLYIRLKIKNLKAKSINVHFFFKEPNENVDPIKYLGRGKVVRITTKIKLNHYTDCFFIFFFKIIYNFYDLTDNLIDLRGVQIVCSDIMSANFCHAQGKKSILYYFCVEKSGDSTKRKKMDTVQTRETQVNTVMEQSIKGVEKMVPDNSHNRGHQHRRGRGRNLNPRGSSNLYAGRCMKSILWYFFNVKNETGDRKKADTSSNKCVPFSLENGAKKDGKKGEKKSEKKQNNGNMIAKKTHLSRASKSMAKKINITKNYKIFDFFPSILIKRKKRNSDAGVYNDDMKKWINGNTVITQKNIFDSIINRKIKKEVQIKEELNCCYMCYKEILEHVMEKQKSTTNITMHSNHYICKDESVNDNIFCYSYIIHSLYSMNQENEKFNLYAYTKEMISSYISYFKILFYKHECCNDSPDQYYLLKFLATVVDNLCEELHRTRLLDVLHKFLKNFKHIWCLNESGSPFPPLLHRTMVKYDVH